MQISIEIDDNLFNICKNHRIETALIFDKICYLQIIKGGYKLHPDLCLVNLLEIMIADKLVAVLNNQYIVTEYGEELLKELSVTNTDVAIENTQFEVTDQFIQDYFSIFKDINNKFIKVKAGSKMRSLGASSSDIKQHFKKFYIKYGFHFEKKIKSLIKTGSLPENFDLENLILENTKEYLKEQEGDSYQYCKRSDYFIIKHNKDKTTVSTLASLCEQYLDSPPSDALQFNLFDKISL